MFWLWQFCVTNLYSLSNSAHVTRGIWTWVLFATWTRLLWQCGNQASWRLTGTRQPAMSTRGRVRWDWSTHTLWLIGSSYLPSPRFMLIHQTWDLTSFLSGSGILQCLWKGHCHREYLFWWLNGFWLVAHSNCSNQSMQFCFAEFERSPKMTWLDFISGFGGLCGLCLGISFVSVAEILYWFSIRFSKKFQCVESAFLQLESQRCLGSDILY